jgi:hypothetical protein
MDGLPDDYDGRAKEFPSVPKDTPRPAYIGDPESCGDGSTWAYLGRMPDEIAAHVGNWIASDPAPGDRMTITMRMMTDAEVDALQEF